MKTSAIYTTVSIRLPKNDALRILDLERFMPVMTPDQLAEYEAAVCEGRTPVFTDATIAEMERRLDLRNTTLEARFSDAIAKSIQP